MPRSGRASRAAAAVLAAIALVGAAPVEDRRELVAPYLERLVSGAVGIVDGTASGEPRRPSAPPTPYDGVTVFLVPYAASVDARLDAIKAGLRDSLSSYGDAHGSITALREAYERELIAADGKALVLTTVSDAAGAWRVSNVPAGEWLVLGRREVMHDVKTVKTPAKDAARFPDIPVITGYGAVSFWRIRIAVRAGETTSVQFTDRGVWLTAVREERKPTGTPKGVAPWHHR